MNNAEFANLVASIIRKESASNVDNLTHFQITEIILDVLNEHKLEIICTEDQLLSYCVEDVISFYEGNLYYYRDTYELVPEVLAQENARKILKLADRLNSKHEQGFSWEDIDMAIDNWLAELNGY